MKKINLVFLAFCMMILPSILTAQVKKQAKSTPSSTTNPHELKKPAKSNSEQRDVKKTEEKQAAASGNMDEMMKNWQDFMTPGKEHSMMETWNGDWVGHVTMWMAPGTDPTSSESFCTNNTVMGGRYQKSTFKGDFNGMPFEGEGTTGFDNIRKIFVSSWIDNMGTGIMYMEGKWDPKTMTINFSGKSTDPMSGKVSAVRETFQIIDEKTQLMTMYSPGMDGKEFKTMEMKLTR